MIINAKVGLFLRTVFWELGFYQRNIDLNQFPLSTSTKWKDSKSDG